MIIKSKVGNINGIPVTGEIEYLDLEWYETQKRILHKKTRSGRIIAMKFLNENPSLTDGDILYHDHEFTIVVHLRACQCIVIKPGNLYEMAQVCYEIGNKHIALFYESDELLVPYEAPLFAVLEASGFNPVLAERKLLHPLKTSVSGHTHAETKSLFSRILQLTSPNG